MNEIKLFEFEHQEVETITLNDEPLFNPYDVGKCLDLKERTIEKYLLEMDDNERCDLKSQKENLKFIKSTQRFWLKESGVYELIFNSRKPEAKKFRKWVTNEVLPKLRQNGSYQLDTQNTVLQNMIGDFLNTFETITGMKREEIPIQQNQSERAKLANLINDIAKREQIRPNALYDRLYYAYAAEFGVHIPELASKAKVKVPYYLRKHALLAENIYKFALQFFYQDTNIVELMRPPDQSVLSEFDNKL